MKHISIALALILVVVLQLIAGISGRIEDRYRDMPTRCLQPMDFGYCKAKMKRYYFNFKRNQCSPFYYGGCAGNENKFETMEECSQMCENKVLEEAI